MTDCNHPFESIQPYGYAVVPSKGDAINHDQPVERESVQLCTACNTLLVPNGVLVDAPPVTFPPREPVRCRHKGCRKELTQPYAIKMGECVSCCLKRMRDGRGRGFMVGYKTKTSLVPEKAYGTTDPDEIEKKRAYNRKYYRTYRSRRRAEGHAS